MMMSDPRFWSKILSFPRISQFLPSDQVSRYIIISDVENIGPLVLRVPRHRVGTKRFFMERRETTKTASPGNILIGWRAMTSPFQPFRPSPVTKI